MFQDYSQDYAKLNWENCTHPHLYRRGYTTTGKQKWSCATCDKRFISNRKLQDRLTTLKQIATQFKQGKRAAQVVAGVCYRTVKIYYRKLALRYRDQKCACGKRILHSGSCSGFVIMRAYPNGTVTKTI